MRKIRQFFSRYSDSNWNSIYNSTLIDMEDFYHNLKGPLLLVHHREEREIAHGHSKHKKVHYFR